MKLTQKLPFLKELSDREQESINGGATIISSGSGKSYESSSLAFTSTFDGTTTRTIRKSFRASGSGPFAISISTSLDDL
jgi:hypothetical protein